MSSLKLVRLRRRVKVMTQDCVASLWPQFGIEKVISQVWQKSFLFNTWGPGGCHGTDLLAASYLTASRPEKYGRDRLFCPFTFWQTEASCKGGPLQVKGSVAMEESDHNKTIIIINLWSSSSCLLPGHGSDVFSCLHWPAEDLTSSLLWKTSLSSLTKNAESLEEIESTFYFVLFCLFVFKES